MKNVAKNSPGREEAIEATAAAWLAQRDEGLSADEAAEYADWLQADPRHASAAAKLEAAWNALHQLRDFRPEAQAHPDRDLLARHFNRRVLPFPALAVAAAAAAIVAVAAVLWRAHPVDNAIPEQPAQSFATTDGGYQRVTLSDGSVVEMNASTELSVRFSAGERRVRLVRGEAQFNVAKNKERPFWVEAGVITVRAVGTAFNVRLGSREVEVLVTEGKVQLEKLGGTASRATSSVPPPLVVAGQRAVIRASDAAIPQVEAVAPAVIRDALSWQGSRLVFIDKPLAEVVTEFNRRNQIQLVLADPELASLPTVGSFRPENVEAFVHLVEGSFNIVAERRGDSEIVLHKRR